MGKQRRLRKDEVHAAMYPVGNDYYVRLTHIPTQIVVGKELHGKRPGDIKAELLRHLQTKVYYKELEEAKKKMRNS